MVSLPMLPLKMLRDLWLLRGQALAIAFVIAAGLATWILSLSTMNSLQNTMNAFYAEQRFGDIFASAVRAPRHLQARIAGIDGVAAIQLRISMHGRAELETFDDSISLLAQSIPDTREPHLNRPYLTAGRMPSPDTPEVLVNEAFAEAHGLQPGDTITAIIRGLGMSFVISGLATSPEFIYPIAPGHLFPDHQRYAITWIRERQLQAVADMEGAFNNISLRLAGNASEPDVIAQLDRMLAPYGGVGAHNREDQPSHLYLTEELRQLDNMARIFPVIFLGVAVFLLAIVIARMIRQQRDEIATLKAFGYSNSSIALNYLLMVLVIVAIGCIIGVLAGARLGHGLGNLYAEFFRFPWIRYSLGTGVVASGILITMTAALLGSLKSLRAAWRLAPAQAMHAEAPERYRKTLLERLVLSGRLSQTSRMILRHLNRKPWKSSLTIIGLATSVSILMVGNFQGDAIDHMIQVHFGLASRENVTVTFDQPRGPDAILEISRLEGVTEAMPFRAIAARLRHGHREIRTSIQSHAGNSSLHRSLDNALRPVKLPRNGLLLSEYHAGELGVGSGDRITVQILTGRRPEFATYVSGIVREYIGASSYMHIDALNDALLEPGRVAGVYLATDGSADDRLDQRLRALPGVAGVNRSEEAMLSFRETMAELVVIFAFVNTALAGVIAFGVIYNSARLALSERERELASLRVLGYTREEVAWILNGELLLLALLALPVGFGLGYVLCWYIATHMTSELYTIPLVLEPSTYFYAASIAAAALLVSLAIVRRQTFRLDLVGLLKTRE